jgi:hypothetical protein
MEESTLARRKNRSIIETTKAMIHDMDLLMCLWVEACNIDLYILNRCPHRILKDKTLEESFIGEKPYVSHFHVFGCPVYIHVLDKKRTKVEPSNINSIFVGYNKTTKAYWIYIPT